MSLSKFTLPIVLFALTLLSGFWVSKSGKPYQTAIFTLHKLIALTSVAFFVISVAKALQIVPSQSVLIILLILGGLSVAGLFASGALMSIEKTTSSLWLLLHRIAPFLLAGSAAALIWMMLKK